MKLRLGGRGLQPVFPTAQQNGGFSRAVLMNAEFGETCHGRSPVPGANADLDCPAQLCLCFLPAAGLAQHPPIRLVTVARQDGRLESIEALTRNPTQAFDEPGETVDIAEERARAHDCTACEPTGHQVTDLARYHGREGLIKTRESFGRP